MEDPVQAHQRPKRERYGDVLAVALKTLWYVEDGSLPYFADVADHLHRTDSEVRSLDELLNSALDAHLARVGTWQNDDIRRISAWAAILAGPTLIAGIYGMNFAHKPELDWRFGFPFTLTVMATAAGLLHRIRRPSV
ncbi:CorA family divalent cation transporter [Streptomyces sp. NPDC019937]|uniref:CorA family divalent cation transporter n=1 Tax=Streptomyces sp. NPDC019937 TaxID=3154787 RepID=UPI0033E4F33C